MSTIRTSKNWLPEDLNNLSYDETAYYLYGIDIDDKKDKDKNK